MVKVRPAPTSNMSPPGTYRRLLITSATVSRVTCNHPTRRLAGHLLRTRAGGCSAARRWSPPEPPRVAARGGPAGGGSVPAGRRPRRQADAGVGLRALGSRWSQLRHREAAAQEEHECRRQEPLATGLTTGVSTPGIEHLLPSSRARGAPPHSVGCDMSRPPCADPRSPRCLPCGKRGTHG
jgi:hypothetical protein